MSQRGLTWYRPLAFGLTVLVLGFGALISYAQYHAFARADLLGIDYRTMMAFGRDWLERGTIYRDWQFSPYPFNAGAGGTDFGAIPALYPPIAGPVFAVWSFLPAVLWWAVPLGVIGYAIWRLRPAPWAWPVMACALLFPATASIVVVGGTTMWVAAGVAAGILWGWPALVVLLKPTFLPFAIVGVRKRSFWIGLVSLAGVSLVLASEWFRYLEVIRNADSPGLLYSVRDLPIVLVPLIAWLGERRGVREPLVEQVRRAARTARVVLHPVDT